MGFLFILSTDQANKLVLAEVLKGLAASARPSISRHSMYTGIFLGLQLQPTARPEGTNILKTCSSLMKNFRVKIPHRMDPPKGKFEDSSFFLATRGSYFLAKSRFNSFSLLMG
jgi:hypothetical protein